MLIRTFYIDIHHVHNIYIHQKWSLLKGYSKLLIFYKLMSLRLHYLVSLTALMEDMFRVVFTLVQKCLDELNSNLAY